MGNSQVGGSTVNSQITDSVSQANAMVVGAASSEAMSLLDLVSAETLGMSMHNAVTAQQNAQMSTNASITASCARMLQAQSPVPAPEPLPVPVVPPPFMPLDPTEDNSAADLLQDAQKMIEAATKMMNAEETAVTDDKKELKKITALLEAAAKGGTTKAKKGTGTGRKSGKKVTRSNPKKRS